MATRRKMEATFPATLGCSLVLILLQPLLPHALPISAPQAPQFYNITTLSTYSFTSPERDGGAAPPVAADAAGGASDRQTRRANDSSAQASDQAGRSFPVGHKGRHPANILGKPSGEGHWATPAPHSAIVLPFVPLKLYTQVRHTYEVNHKPRSDAVASASSPEELAAAARLRESIQTKKISEVYSEEGYEDSAYDHAGFKKDAGFSEGQEGHEGGRKKTGNGGGSGGGYGGGLSEAASTSEDQKYPFHKVASSDAVPLLSPLRYALNPVAGEIPSKTSGGTEFYDSTDNVECPTVVELPSIPDRAFRRPPEDSEGESAEKEEGEEGEESREPKLAPTPPPPPTPRLKGLGDKIDCLRTKFFGGEEPLDNPFFKEQVVNVAKNEIMKAKAEQSKIKEEIEKDKAVGEESKRNENVEPKGKDALVQPNRREKSRRGYAAGFESYNPEAAANNVDKRNTSGPAVAESVGEDRMGEETEDSAAGGVGAAVEGLPSAAASDSDMQGFYADIMGHIQSATGSIVRQAYSGRNGADSEGRARRIRPPKTPRPPIIGFLDEREPFPASQYPSVLPAPSNYEESDNRYSVAEDVDEGEGEEYAGSERDEEEEEGDEEGDHKHHHHHSHPSFLGGAQKIILRPINPQSQRYTSGGTGGSSIGTEAPFRPSPLLYVQTHPAPQRVVVPAHTHSSHHSSADSHMHHHHHHRPYSGEHHSLHHHSPPGIRTFLIPAGKRPVPLSPPPIGHHYHINTINGLRGSGTLLIPASTRHTSTTPIYPSISLYPSRSPFSSLKRQSPFGQEFDGLLTATTQSVTTLAALPSNFGKYHGQQPLVDMVASSSSVSKSFSPPRKIEYFTLKDSLPHNKNPSVASKLLPPESETLIPQITFITTEKYSNLEEHYASSNVAPLPPMGVNTDNVQVPKTYDSATVESATQEYPHSESIHHSETESGLTHQAMATAKSDSTLEAAVLSTVATKLVTEEVAKGVVRAAIEEGAKKRRKNLRVTKINDSVQTDFTGMSTKRPRIRRRKNRIGLRKTNEEEGEVISGETNMDSVSIKWDKKSQLEGTTEDTNKAVLRTINSRGNRVRKGERGASRTRVGLTEINGRNQRARGHKRGEPGYNTPAEDTNSAAKIKDATDTLEDIAKSDKIKRSTSATQQKVERRTGIIPKESSTTQDFSGDSSKFEGSSRLLQGSPRDQSSLQTDKPPKEIIPSFSEGTENVQNQKPSEQIEEPRKMFVEPRIRGDRRKVQIPRKVVTRSRSQHRIRVTTDINDDTKSTGTSNPEGTQKRTGSISTDPAVKRWEVSKRRILTSLEGVGEDSSRGRHRETERKSPHTGSTSNRSTSSRVDNRDNPNNQRVVRHREVKETLTSVYAPEE